MAPGTETQPLADGTVYSKRKDFCPFSVPALESYAPIVGEEKIERLLAAVERVRPSHLCSPRHRTATTPSRYPSDHALLPEAV
jgi:hypothetical protein